MKLPGRPALRGNLWTSAAGASVAAALLLATPAGAAAPTRESVPFTDTRPAAVLSQACGFPVTSHLEGTMTVTDFVDRAGNFKQEITLFRLVATFSANGHVISGHTTQPIKTVAQPDGSFTVAFMGVDGLFTLPGSGPVVGQIGRLLLQFPADGGPPTVLQETGPAFLDPAPVCAALAP